MKLLVSSLHFHPSVGGLETATRVLAGELSARGHEVVVVTLTPERETTSRFAFRVVRRPGPMSLLRLVSWCDLYWQNNISLRLAWPLLLHRKPWVVTHQGALRRPDGRLAWQDGAKRIALRFARSVCISEALAADLPGPTDVIPNPYCAAIFHSTNEERRPMELIFVGRLVSDKGVSSLLDALALLRARGIAPRLSVVGDGPERAALAAQVERQGLAGQVCFAGRQTPEAIARLLRQARILVVPSLWAEPFGIVALEGLACGCVVVGSRGGGLGEAIGPAGLTFTNGDIQGLADSLASLLGDAAKLQALRAAAGEHLKRFTPAAVADAYERLFREAAGCRA